MGSLAIAVLLLGVLLVAVFPARSYWAQRTATTTAEAELAEVLAERERIAREADLLETPEEIERRAREEFGFQRPEEEVINVLPPRADPIGLPETWPFTGVERVLAAR